MGYGWPDLGDPVLSDCDVDALAFVFAWASKARSRAAGRGPYDCSLTRNGKMLPDESGLRAALFVCDQPTAVQSCELLHPLIHLRALRASAVRARAAANAARFRQAALGLC